jgi:hypothetical protein
MAPAKTGMPSAKAGWAAASRPHGAARTTSNFRHRSRSVAATDRLRFGVTSRREVRVTLSRCRCRQYAVHVNPNPRIACPHPSDHRLGGVHAGRRDGCIGTGPWRRATAHIVVFTRNRGRASWL